MYHKTWKTCCINFHDERDEKLKSFFVRFNVEYFIARLYWHVTGYRDICKQNLHARYEYSRAGYSYFQIETFCKIELLFTSAAKPSARDKYCPGVLMDINPESLESWRKVEAFNHSLSCAENEIYVRRGVFF